MLRSEHQKNASRTIRETVDLQIHKRNKERDKDKERFQSHQLTVSLTQDPMSEGESGSIISVSVWLYIHKNHDSTECVVESCGSSVNTGSVLSLSRRLRGSHPTWRGWLWR